MDKNYFKIESQVISALKQVYDPEIPVNVYDLGLIYKMDIDKNDVNITMTLTAPNCPIADQIVEQVKQSIEKIDDTNKVEVKLVFDPPWSMDMMSDEAKLQLGFM